MSQRGLGQMILYAGFVFGAVFVAMIAGAVTGSSGQIERWRSSRVEPIGSSSG